MEGFRVVKILRTTIEYITPIGLTNKFNKKWLKN